MQISPVFLTQTDKIVQFTLYDWQIDKINIYITDSNWKVYI